jgi:uncharacterized protein
MKTSTINLAIPAQLLRQADEIAKRESRSRSELMREALRKYLDARARIDRIFAYADAQTAKRGLRPEDVGPAIAEYRKRRAGSRWMKVVFDSNVWVSSFAFKGRVRNLIDAVLTRRIEVVVSPEIIEETIGVLAGRKFGFPNVLIAEIERQMREMARVVRPDVRVKVVRRDSDDDRILECALAAGADAIITGDEDLLSIGVFRGIRIISPGDFLDELARWDEPGGFGVHEAQAPYRVGKKAKRKRRAKSRWTLW